MRAPTPALDRAVPPPPPGETSEFAARVALFAVVMNAKQPASLLDGLAEFIRDDALEVLTNAKAWLSPTRQARVSLEFGARPDQHERLSALVVEASPALRRALYVHMSPQQQARFPHLATKDSAPVSIGMASLAARLVREATR